MTKTEVDDALLESISDAFNSRDIDRIMSFFADDAVFATARGPHPYGERYVGKAAIGKFLGDRLLVTSRQAISYETSPTSIKSAPAMRRELRNHRRFLRYKVYVYCSMEEQTIIRRPFS
jgi:hypothetical protein